MIFFGPSPPALFLLPRYNVFALLTAPLLLLLLLLPPPSPPGLIAGSLHCGPGLICFRRSLKFLLLGDLVRDGCDCAAERYTGDARPEYRHATSSRIGVKTCTSGRSEARDLAGGGLVLGISFFVLYRLPVLTFPRVLM